MSTESVESAVESADLIIEELRRVESAFRKLQQPQHYQWCTRQFVKPSDRESYQEQKQHYKKIRDDALRWLKHQGKKPKFRVDYDKGFYAPDGRFVDYEQDIPMAWQVQAKQLKIELEAVYNQLIQKLMTGKSGKRARMMMTYEEKMIDSEHSPRNRERIQPSQLVQDKLNGDTTFGVFVSNNPYMIVLGRKNQSAQFLQIERA